MLKLIRIVIVSVILCKEFIKYGDIQNTSLTPDKELNILIYKRLPMSLHTGDIHC